MSSPTPTIQPIIEKSLTLAQMCTILCACTHSILTKPSVPPQDREGRGIMTLTTLGPMLSEINAMLQAKGCKVTEVSVTFQALEDDAVLEAGDIRLWLDHTSRSLPAVRGTVR
jgi:hypothetical protein